MDTDLTYGINMELTKELNVDKLNIKIFDKRKDLGKAAADLVEDIINVKLKTQYDVRMIFAAAPSQNEFLENFAAKNIDWERITAFQMDEYIGLNAGSEPLFSTFLTKRLFNKVNMKKVNFFNPIYSDLEAECKRYADLLTEEPIDIVCMGIGENGHIAFNDPPVADFNDPKIVKVVELDDKCKQQQVNDGCFPSFDDVPAHAFTLTIPALLSANYISCVVPGKTKAEAVFNTLNGEITTQCPASILRTRDNAVLFVDNHSASLL